MAAKRSVFIPGAVFESDNYRALAPKARCAFSEMLAIARQYPDIPIAFSERQAAERLGVDRKTARAALREVESRGFAVCVERGTKQKGFATLWRLTCLRCDGQPPTNDFLRPDVAAKIERAHRIKAVQGVEFSRPSLRLWRKMFRSANRNERPGRRTAQ